MNKPILQRLATVAVSTFIVANFAVGLIFLRIP
jgi:hypothetical protein